MEFYPWWTDEQRAFAQEIEEFGREIRPREAETRWTREFPADIFATITERRYTGAAIAKEYGGLGLGATGVCIAVDELSRMPGVGRIFIGNMLGGLRQVLDHGTDEQKKRFLPRIARGEPGAIVITEPFAGTDASSIETTAKRDGDAYRLKGKKRFITSAGVAKRYMVYARTSADPEEIRRHRHLTAFIVEKGMPGFTVEKINEVAGFSNVQNGVLNFDRVPVPVENRLGEEGQGWGVMTGGLNFERTLVSAQAVGWLRETLANVVPYTQRRVQFGRPTIEIPENQFKIANLVIKTRIARLLTYYTAYLWDRADDITIESNMLKVYACESALQASIDAIQVMGGDGLTPFYPLHEIMDVAKVETIAGGTVEACRLVIFRTALRQMADDFRMTRRVVHPTLGVPVPAAGDIVKEQQPDEASVVKVLAEDYRVNPGLFMTRADLHGAVQIDDARLDEILVALEAKGLVKLCRGRQGIELAKATYDGLDTANPPDYYRWFPSWIAEEDDRVF